MFPRTLGGIIGFVFVATVSFMVGSYIYGRFVAPLLKKAA
jgi:hypothetical protein